MLDGVRTAVNTVVFATPLLGTGIAFMVASSGMRDMGPATRALSGAITGGMVSGIWEYTVNSSDRPEIKAEIIMGSAAIGAGAGVVGPAIF